MISELAGRFGSPCSVPELRSVRAVRGVLTALTVAALAGLAAPAFADQLLAQDEMSTKSRWVQSALLSSEKPVISFIYDGVPSAEIVPGWKRTPIADETLSEGRTRHRLQWTDPATGLEATVVMVDYADYPAVEWTGYLKNTGSKPTPIIERLRSIDSQFAALGPLNVALRTTHGDDFSANSYEPLSFELGRTPLSFQPNGGRPTNGAWPYFNLDGGKEGIIVAVGWPGQWQATFSRDKNAIAVQAGQETTHLVLEPGEEIRTPLTAVLFWRRDNWIAGQNLWRHWFLAHSIPRPGGKLPPTISSVSVPELHTAAATDLSFLKRYLDHGYRPDYFWVDAGWYEMDQRWFSATGVGTWKPDPVRYPHGIREVADFVHAKGIKLILWFEPERVYRGSFLWDHHPEWLLKWKPGDKDRSDLRLLNLGNPDARQWLTDYVSTFLTEQGVDLYRQDFNIDPLGAWETNDAPDRRGMTENLYVQGYLAYWDALLQQHPGMLIDSCASGGRRNDLETLRRSVPLLRSDYQAPNLPGNKFKMSTDVFDGNQGHTYGLSLWVPFYGTGEYAEDEYSARSHLCPAMNMATHIEHPNWKAFDRQVADHRAVAEDFYGDYYPLTPYSKSEDVWIAWEFFRPVEQQGMIQAFRRENNPDTDVTLKLAGLKAQAYYEFTNLDSGVKTTARGSELMADGIRLEADSPRTALIITFKEID